MPDIVTAAVAVAQIPDRGIPQALAERRKRCWRAEVFYDPNSNEGVVRRYCCKQLTCSWCREGQESALYQRYCPAGVVIVERHLVHKADLVAFNKRVKRHGGEKVHIPAPGDRYVVLVHGAPLGGEEVDAAAALIEAIENHPGGRTGHVAASAGWYDLVDPGIDTPEITATEHLEVQQSDPIEWDPWDLENGPEAPLQPLIHLGRMKRPFHEVLRDLQRRGVHHRISRRADGTVTVRFPLPPPDTWDFLILTGELLGDRYSPVLQPS